MVVPPRFVVTEPTRPSTLVVQAVAQSRGVDPDALPPLYDFIDPDALDNLVDRGGVDDPRTSVEVRFTYADRQVAIADDGTITVDDDVVTVEG